ncbi:hypothetical protein KNO15_11280 [Leifsonia shinshuensis]|uniref:hypothetical protein n=1 Tax=Leifsonia shinshuensis TaxID=150026 RepID=UPI001F506FFA|nr:hypothetical protein [Leifsonia shinshuensis]MCI0157277.1 hypothetical protein [Leifsonia shinshuensis]
MTITAFGSDSGSYPDALARCLQIAQIIAARTARRMNAFMIADDDPFAEVDTDRQDHSGSKAIRIDTHLGEFVNELIKSHELMELALGPITCFQEERRAAYSSRDDRAHVRVIVDPLDGSSILGAFGTGCVSVLVYSNLNSKGEWRLYAGAIALNSGILFSYKVRRRTIRKPEIDAEIFAHTFNPHPSGDAGTDPDLAFKAFDLEDRNLRKKDGVSLISASASEGRRIRAAEYLGSILPSLKFQGSFAGNLSIWGALLGTASVIHDPERATLHDANYVVFLSATDWHVYDATTNHPLDIDGLFNIEPQAGVTEEKRVPAMIAVRDPEILSRAESYTQQRSA